VAHEVVRQWTAEVPSICKKCRMSRFVLTHGFGEAHALLFQTYCPSPALSRLAKGLMADLDDATIFCEHFERFDA
jgi:hypothetical protein